MYTHTYIYISIFFLFPSSNLDNLVFIDENGNRGGKKREGNTEKSKKEKGGDG